MEGMRVSWVRIRSLPPKGESLEPTMHQDLLGYISSHMTLEAIINVEMKRWWPEEPPAAINHVLSFNIEQQWSRRT